MFKNVVKAAFVWFAAGALFALGANLLAPALGAGAIATLAADVSPLWLGSMLAGTAAIATAATPMIDLLFGDTKAEAKIASRELCEARQVNVNIQQSPQAYGQIIENSKLHQQNIDAERVAAVIAGDRNMG